MPSEKGMSTKHIDSVLMYCSFFTYGKEQAAHRKAACEMATEGILQKVNDLESRYPFWASAYFLLSRPGKALQGVNRYHQDVFCLR